MLLPQLVPWQDEERRGGGDSAASTRWSLFGAREQQLSRGLHALRRVGRARRRTLPYIVRE